MDSFLCFASFEGSKKLIKYLVTKCNPSKYNAEGIRYFDIYDIFEFTHGNRLFNFQLKNLYSKRDMSPIEILATTNKFRYFERYKL